MVRCGRAPFASCPGSRSARLRFPLLISRPHRSPRLTTSPESLQCEQLSRVNHLEGAGSMPTGVSGRRFLAGAAATTTAFGFDLQLAAEQVCERVSCTSRRIPRTRPTALRSTRRVCRSDSSSRANGGSRVRSTARPGRPDGRSSREGAHSSAWCGGSRTCASTGIQEGAAERRRGLTGAPRSRGDDAGILGVFRTEAPQPAARGAGEKAKLFLTGRFGLTLHFKIG